MHIISAPNIYMDNILWMDNWPMAIFPLSGRVKPCKESPEVKLSTQGKCLTLASCGRKGTFSK